MVMDAIHKYDEKQIIYHFHYMRAEGHASCMCVAWLLLLFGFIPGSKQLSVRDI